ncbi:TRM11 family methyltransferase [Tsukamurella strandjordii]|uniref:TRM11 family SAM-dependent methyltransferase n=1 Tax=Tsukamurella strandjordii TaxID=147577 RepID=UPI0031D33C50
MPAVPRYLLLPAPAANRVYAESTAAMVRAELTVLSRAAMAGSVGAVETETVAGVEYLAFDAEPLTAQDLAFVGLASAFYALFERDGDLLRPIAVPSPEKYPTDLLTILKYQGKTNEQFTRLVLNVSAASTARPAGLLDGTLRVLDPVCGRGTTLSQAVMYGLDAVGVDVDTKDFELYTSFFTTWLKDHRYKHTAATTPVRREKTVIAKKYEASFAAEKADYLAGEKQALTFYAADTLRTPELVRPGTIDVLVGDLPYGVQHGSRGPRGLVRNPLELLDAALPGWVATLRRGGALGLAWNVRVAPREQVAAALTGAGLTVQGGPGYDDLQHRVDRVITRDVIVARRD